MSCALAYGNISLKEMAILSSMAFYFCSLLAVAILPHAITASLSKHIYCITLSNIVDNVAAFACDGNEFNSFQKVGYFDRGRVHWGRERGAGV